MGIDALFYRMMVVFIAALTACVCAVIVARCWLRVGRGIGHEAECGVSVWPVTGELIANIAFPICARMYSDYSERMFDHLWVGCLSLSASLTLAAIVVRIRSTSPSGKMFKVRMVLLVALNLLGVASIVMRRQVC